MQMYILNINVYILNIGIFLVGLTFLSQIRTFSRNLVHHWKGRERKKTFQTNLVIIFSFSKGLICQSKTKLDVCQSKFGIRVALRLAERLKT